MKTEKHAMNVSSLSKDYKILCDIIGIDKALEVARVLGGSRLYIPMFKKLVRGIKYRAIQKEFNGNNHRELALKYGYSERWIRIILEQTT